MGADGFVTLAGHFGDRTVVTYDPRGAGRSPRTDGAQPDPSPDEHADDLHRIISALDAGPVDIFANSGGAVNALALVAKHPKQVRTLLAHEPPALPRSTGPRARSWPRVPDIRDTYQRSGFGPVMAKFIVLVSYALPAPGRLRRGARARPGQVRPAGAGRRLPERPAGRAEHHYLLT